MQRFFVPSSAIHGRHVSFLAEQQQQIRTVLRLGDGSDVLVLDGSGQCHHTRLQFRSAREVTGWILASYDGNGEPVAPVFVCQSITRGDRFEWLLQKGTELGVTRFQPMITARTVRKAPGRTKWLRWQRIVREAAEQSGRTQLPLLLEPVTFSQALQSATGTLLIPSTQSHRPVHHGLADTTWPVTIFIGPEGGFTPEEILLARSKNACTVSLGPRILRAETAALVLLTLVMDAMGEFSRPAPYAKEENNEQA